jgi:hypothetical protein
VHWRAAKPASFATGKEMTMGLPFSLPLLQIFERVSLPLQHFLAAREDADHVMMWDCYTSGQMSDAELEREIAEDPDFAAFVKQRISRFN